MILPAKPKPRQNETRDLTRPIIVALNKIAGVRVVRNVDRGLMVPFAQIHMPNPTKIMTGLGKGGSDIVGVVRMRVDCGVTNRVVQFGRLFTLECKRWERRHAHSDTRADQRRWRDAVIRLGGFAGLIEARDRAEGIRMAIEAVERCRRGESE
ncbi:MAG: hypothetical protein WBY94_03170 [Polyangiaceae bacterium]